MPRIVGVEVPKEKRIVVSLTYLYGIGPATSAQVLQELQISPDKRAKDLTEDEVSRLTITIQKNYKVEGDLRRDVSANIKRLMDIGAYRGLRHKKGLPTRGQRTRTNARTRKGPKRNMASIVRKPAAAPAAAKKPA